MLRPFLESCLAVTDAVMVQMGKLLILFGAIFIVLGVVVQLLGKLPDAGRLPGDILIRKGPVTFYFPLVTCLIISLVLSLLVSFFWRR